MSSPTHLVLVCLDQHIQLVKVEDVVRHDRLLILVLLPQTHQLIRQRLREIGHNLLERALLHDPLRPFLPSPWRAYLQRSHCPQA